MDSKPNKSKSILINLKILGELEIGVKLNTRERYFELDDPSWYQGARRKWRGDTKQSAYEKISELILDTKEMLENSTTDPSSLENSLEEFNAFMVPILEKASKGLRSLQETYSYDKTFISQIDLEINVLERMIQKLDPEHLIENTILVSNTQQRSGSDENYG